MNCCRLTGAVCCGFKEWCFWLGLRTPHLCFACPTEKRRDLRHRFASIVLIDAIVQYGTKHSQTDGQPRGFDAYGTLQGDVANAYEHRWRIPSAARPVQHRGVVRSGAGGKGYCCNGETGVSGCGNGDAPGKDFGVFLPLCSRFQRPCSEGTSSISPVRKFFCFFAKFPYLTAVLVWSLAAPG